MDSLLNKLTVAVERGKVDADASYPPDLKDQDGAAELTTQLLEAGYSADEILSKGLMPGMKIIGDRFAEGKAFIPDLLIAAKAMNAAMEHLKPFFESGEAHLKGTIILGTVKGDMHDIGKNLLKMVLKGDGWKVVDLGTDTNADDFLQALNEHPGSMVGLSALLTTTMLNMKPITTEIKKQYPGTKVFVGGAPLSGSFAVDIGADGFFRDPRSFVNYLATLDNDANK